MLAIEFWNFLYVVMPADDVLGNGWSSIGIAPGTALG